MFNLSLKDTWDGNKHFCSILGTDANNDSSKHFKHAETPPKVEKEEEARSETFLACNDEKSASHFRANGTVGYGKFKGASVNGESHTNGTSPSTNGTNNGVNNGVQKNGQNGHPTNGTTNGLNGTKH